MKNLFFKWRIELFIGMVFAIVSFIFLLLISALHNKGFTDILIWIYIIPMMVFTLGGILVVYLKRIDSFGRSFYESFLMGIMGSAVYYILSIGHAFLWMQIPLTYESLFVFIGGVIMAIPLVVGSVIGGFLGFLIRKLNK